MKIRIIILTAILLYAPLLSEGFSRTKPPLFDGKLYLSNAPLVGQKAILTFDLVSVLGDYGTTTIKFRTPDGVSLLGRSTFTEPFFIKGASKSYSAEIEVTEKGTYALQASVYTQISQDYQEIEHFFIYLIVKDTYSQIAEKVDSFTMSKKGILVQHKLAPPDLAMAQGVLSFNGYIKYYNDNLNRLVPIKKVAVQLYEIIQTKNQLITTVYTDDQGFYSFDNISNPNMEQRSFQLVIAFNNNTLNLVNDKSETYKFDLPPIQNVSGGIISNDYIFNETNQFRCLGHIFNSVVDAGDFLINKLNWSRKKIPTKWPYKEGNTSLYTYTYNVATGSIVSESLNIAVGKEWDRTTMLHEYGHSIMSALYGYNYNNLPKGSYKETIHYVNTVSDVEFAMKEGWAEFSEALFDDNAFNLTQYTNANTPNIEYNEWWKGKDLNNTKGEIVEGTVASILWDIADTAQSKDENPNIDDDEINGMLTELWDTMSKKKPKNIIDFWNYWQDNNYGQIPALYKIFINNSVNVTIKPQNRPPVANPQSIITNEDTAVNITLTGSDEDSDPITFKITRFPSKGNISGQPPNLKYTPNPNFFGTDSFDFVVNDGKVDSQSATVTITIVGVNDPPIANSQSVEVDEDSQITITLTGSDPENDNLTYKIISQPLKGSLSATGSVVIYKPNADFNGDDSFTFSVKDGELESSPAKVSIKVKPVNDLPVVIDQSVITDEDTSIKITLTGTDVENDPLTFKIIKQPTNGTLEGKSPDFIYTPKQDFNGNDTFTFIANDGKADSNIGNINITVKPVNDPPIANPQSVEVDEDSQITITLTGSDPENDNLTYKIISQPLKGSLSGTGSVVIYKPNADFNGDDSFTFSVNDGELESSPAKVSIKVKPVNDPPVAIDQSVTTDEDKSIKVTLTGTDVENDPLTFKIIKQPTNGTLEGKSPDFTYKPKQDFNGNDTFTFITNDGKADSNIGNINITVKPVNDPPIANSQSVEVDEDSQITITLTGSDPENDNLTYKIISQPLKGSLSGTGSVVIYKPNADFNGDDSFTFSVNDGELESSPAKVSIKVKPVNDPPVAIDQSVTTDEYVSIKIILSGTDIDDDKLTFKIVNQPKNGTLDGKLPELVYKPNYGFGGEDSFTFVANDGKSDSAPATIKIMVNLTPNPVDINRDGIVNILDLVIIGIYYGKDDFPTDHNPDVNRDRKVDDKDLEIVKNNFGKKF